MLRFLSIARYKFKLILWYNLNLYRGIWGSGFGGFRGCSICRGTCHIGTREWNLIVKHDGETLIRKWHEWFWNTILKHLYLQWNLSHWNVMLKGNMEVQLLFVSDMNAFETSCWNICICRGICQIDRGYWNMVLKHLFVSWSKETPPPGVFPI